MKDLVQQVREYIKNNQLINDLSQQVVVGLSGGADSVALLHILVQSGYSCIPAHCNFQLRGEESERDERFALEYARSLGLNPESIRFNTTRYARDNKLSIEMAARELRYKWFEELRIRHHAEWIAVGHHADDNIETILLNLIRGTGLKGLTGMQAKNGKVIRPLLEFDRIDITNYLKTNSLQFVDDSTNTSSDYTRNKLRHELIPVMRSINPSLNDSFRNTLHNLNDSFRFQQDSLLKIKNNCCRQEGETLRIAIAELTASEHKEFILYEILQEYQFNSTQVHDIIQALNGISGKLFFSPHFQLLKDRNELIVSRREPPYNNSLPEINCSIYNRENTMQIISDPAIIQLDADLLHFPLKLRFWKTGDVFYPLGLNRRKKVSDFLIDLKIDRTTKQQIKVVTTLVEEKEEIVWIAGLRIDHRFRITDRTKTIAQIQLKEP